MAGQKLQPIKIFYCYALDSGKDKRLRDELAKHLEPLRRGKVKMITAWREQDLLAGAVWDEAVQTHFQEAHIILLLLSSDFAASEACHDLMEQARTRQQTEQIFVVPILLREMLWELLSISSLQLLPSNKVPIASWHNEDQALASVAQDIYRLVRSLIPKITLSLNELHLLYPEETKQPDPPVQQEKDALSARTEQPALPAQTLLAGRYQLVGRVGEGGMGAVYRATDNNFRGRMVAVKEMNAAGLPQDKLQGAEISFTQEAFLLASLLHPNLPRIYDHFTENDRSYLVMDFIEGQTLADYLKKRASMQPEQLTPFAQVLAWAEQLCEVLNYLHTHQPSIIFRDLKPANIMLSPHKHIYLIDFGIARIFKPGQAYDTVSLGSPGYAAPEQYGRSQSSPRSDIYSLGALLHYLLTGSDPGEHPFFFQPASQLNPTIHAELSALLQQMLEMDPQKRPASISEVLTELQRCAALSVLSPIDALLAQASDLYKQKRLAEALATFNKVLESNPSNALGWQGYGLTQGLLLHHQEALESFESALSINPTLVTSWNGKGTALMVLKRYQEALQAFERALELDRQNAAAWNGKGAALNALGNFELALSALETVLILDPTMAQAWNNKGLILNQQKNYPEALAAFEQALHHNPQLATSLAGKGTALQATGHNEEALETFEQACQISPALIQAWVGRGLVLYELRRLREALSMFDTALSLDDKYAGAYFGKGQVLYAENRLQEAQTMYERAIQCNPHMIEAWTRRGNLADQMGDFQLALQYYDRALRLDPHNALAWNGKGSVLRQQGSYYDALKAYNFALDIEPDFALAWNGKGNTLYNINKHAEAIEAYEKALEINPVLATGWHNKAVVLNTLHRYEEARVASEEAIRLRGNDPDNWQRKADALKGLKRRQEAKKAEEQARRLRGEM